MAAHHDDLIAIMVLISAADNNMTDKELKKMGDVVGNWPVFENFAVADLPATATRISDTLGQEDGLEPCSTRCRTRSARSCAKPPTRWPARWPRPTGC